MKEFQWPYRTHDKEIFLSKIIIAESYLQKYGAKYVDKVNEMETWMLQDGSYVIEYTEKNIWKFNEEYVRIGKVYLEKPFIVLEFSNKKEGPYDDAEPFPYDISNMDIEQEIKFSLGIK